MNSHDMKAFISCYFRYTRQYPLICFERGPDSWNNYYPDILAVTKSRKLIETEVKISIADLKNDTKKRIWQLREMESKKILAHNSNYHFKIRYGMPYQFYYAVPQALEQKAKLIIEEWKKEKKIYGRAGLIVVIEPNENLLYEQLPQNLVRVSMRSAINKDAIKLSPKTISQMVKNQSGTICSLICKISKMQNEK